MVRRLVHRTDQNAKALTQVLEQCGVQVTSFQSAGNGIPDAYCTKGPKRGAWVEFKAPDGKLTPDQERFIGAFLEPVWILRTTEDCMRLAASM
jgi:hypothetical protein